MATKETSTEKIEVVEEKERKIIVDLWRIKLHGEIVGIKQKEEHMAKSRQFNRDLELFGEVREEINGEEAQKEVQQLARIQTNAQAVADVRCGFNLRVVGIGLGIRIRLEIHGQSMDEWDGGALDLCGSTEVLAPQ